AARLDLDADRDAARCDDDRPRRGPTEVEPEDHRPLQLARDALVVVMDNGHGGVDLKHLEPERPGVRDGPRSVDEVARFHSVGALRAPDGNRFTLWIFARQLPNSWANATLSVCCGNPWMAPQKGVLPARRLISRFW